MNDRRFVRWLDELGNEDVESVGGKNASLGEMIRNLSEQGVRVPTGFATTADAYRAYLQHNDLDAYLHEQIGELAGNERALGTVGGRIRRAFRSDRLSRKPVARALNRCRWSSGRGGIPSGDWTLMRVVL